MNESDLRDLLERGRERERAQTLFYRRLAALAEDAGDAVAAERLNALLADEQHHLSRLTARLLELGSRPADGEATTVAGTDLLRWEETARRREAEEVSWYEDAARRSTDEATRAILLEILDSERHHHEELAGKWMPASLPHVDTGGRP